ncbi:MAG: single-stranded-DNA-specific exonuclease RecJ [Cyanobacteria bacterium P01_H01_bin.15]
MNSARWLLPPDSEISAPYIAMVQELAPDGAGKFSAQLLWQRGIRTAEVLQGFLDVDAYQPTSPFAFGEEMQLAVARLERAIANEEKVAIWGDFDADGITSTSVLWEGLGLFFPQTEKLKYLIPNRLKESHGLNKSGIDELADWGANVIVTCDTGSTNIEEILYACDRGIDVIVTDHHTLPPERPSVSAIVNPRYLANDHPLFNLSGVAVAYKLVEALCLDHFGTADSALPLLDLVAIGLIADLVELRADCRYLAQRGIATLKRTERPGLIELLQRCRRTGDRPTDISFGIGPRINAVSRIHGDASFCVELLTSQDPERCSQLAEETELANLRRKETQRDVLAQAQKKLAQLDLSTTGVVILSDPQWPGGVLGLVAGQIAQETGKPTIALTTPLPKPGKVVIAKGSARSVNQIDLYQLVDSQRHWLTSFGGHPFAAGLALPVENIPFFRDGINQQLKQIQTVPAGPELKLDLTVTVADLQKEAGRKLFNELHVLEPYGMGNPIPTLLIRAVKFSRVSHKNPKDAKGKKVRFIKTSFFVEDDSCDRGFPCIWWGHYKDDVPTVGRWDVAVELDYNSYRRGYELRLVDLRPAENAEALVQTAAVVLDYRTQAKPPDTDAVVLSDCPRTWGELRKAYQAAQERDRPLVLAYSSPDELDFAELWRTLVGVAKYLARTGESIPLAQLQAKLKLDERTLSQGLSTLHSLGLTAHLQQKTLIFETTEPAPDSTSEFVHFQAAIAELQFQQQYFYEAPLEILTTIL